MTAGRRLAKLAGALSPKAATLLWLEEAHQFRSLPAYVDWLIDQPISAAPLERVPMQAKAAAVRSLRGQPREIVREAAHVAVRDAIFLVELVLKLNVAAESAIQLLGLRYAALFWEMRAISAEAELETGSEGTRGRRTIARRWAAWRAAVSAWLTDLYSAVETRLLLEHQYLDGRGALFPDLGRDWESLRETAERLVVLRDSLAVARDRTSSKRGPQGLTRRGTAVRSRTEAYAACIADSARGAALDVLGDADGAVAIAGRMLRPIVH
jgi:hypothetical protein